MKLGTQGNNREEHQRLAQAKVRPSPSEEQEARVQEDTGEQIGGPGKWPKCACRMDSIEEDQELTGQWVAPSGSSATQEQMSSQQPQARRSR